MRIFKNMLKIILSGIICIPSISYSNKLSQHINTQPIITKQYYIYTQKGNRLKVYEMIENKNGLNKKIINNYGWIFTEGNYWLDEEQVPIILKDNYQEIPFKKMQENDIVMIYSGKKPIHSLIACQPNNKTRQCENMKQPDLYHFVMLPEKVLLNPEIIKVYRAIKK